MELKDQVVSLELAKKLKELGVKQDSYFAWYKGEVRRWNQLTQELRKGEPPVSAFTVAELGEMLPKKLFIKEEIKDGGINFPLVICPSFDDGWFVGYGEHMSGNGYKVIDDKNLYNALAKMLIYLIEQKLCQVNL